MENVIHAHDVLHLLAESEGGLLLEDLRSLLHRTFGSDARFTNCADARFTVDELLLFFERRGKISVSGGRARVNAENVCKH
jgi:probable metal-binding protein